MVFSSFAFLFLFLPAVLVCYFLIPPRFRSARNLILLLFSLCFYLYGEPKGIGVMLGVIALSYVSAVVLDRTKTTRVRRLLMIAAIAGMVAVIGYYKYSGFAVENINRVLGTSLPVPAVIMPIGISFFTFQSMSYVIDVYRRTVPAQKNPLYVALYVSLFPQLVAGPIVRYETVAEEIITRRETVQDFHDGLARFIVGLGKKMLLANPLGDVATEIFALSGSALTPAKAWIGAILFAFQILFDFSGYSDMAIGVSKILGIDLPRNFNLPYIAHNVTELWKRWHITLSSWLQEYLYISLGGNRKGTVRTYINLVLTMLIGGLWHGASWPYVFWGLLHGLALAVHKAWMKITGSAQKQHSVISNCLSIAVTFLFTNFVWVFFRAESVQQAFKIIHRIFCFDTGISQPYMWLFIALVILLAATVTALCRSRKKPERPSKTNVSYIDGYYPLLKLDSFWGLVIFFVFVGLILSLAYTGGSPFIYGNY